MAVNNDGSQETPTTFRPAPATGNQHTGVPNNFVQNNNLISGTPVKAGNNWSVGKPAKK